MSNEANGALRKAVDALDRKHVRTAFGGNGNRVEQFVKLEDVQRLATQFDAESDESYRDKAEGLLADLDGAVEKLWEVGGERGRAALSSVEPTPSPEPQASNAGAGIYVASKTRHAAAWKAYRERGWPINSTWIDEAGVGESGDLNDLWRRCISEASSAAVLVVYREPGDVLEGGWVEVGAALAAGVPVYAVGIDGSTIAHDKRIQHFETLDDAMDAAAHRAALSTPEPQTGERDGEVVADLERIWLQNAKDGEASNDGRLWCADKVWPDDALDGEPTEYVRVDLFEAERTAREAAEARVREQQQAMEEDDGMVAEQVTRAEAAENRLAEVQERAREDGIRAAISLVEKLANEHARECGIYDYTTNVVEFDGAAEDVDIAYQDTLRELAALRAKPEAQAIAQKESKNADDA